ncbi:EAL domain-containing protein [Marinobacterium aestuariivivens]|uniref:EAL domain-containing protein n=1 Tax=Marinobacterium aestuariivivens TaxID=1698799 RepID=A0ABW2A9A9_9GAMM
MIIPMFQPVKSTTTGDIVGAEVLIRWLFDGVYYSPSDVRVEIRWGDIDKAMILLLIKNIDAIDKRYNQIMVNVSEDTLKSDHLFHSWCKQVRRFNMLSRTEFMVEVTEGVSDTTILRRWDALKKLGASLVMDDYGHQNSSLDRLVSYPWDACKFDVKRVAGTDRKDAEGLQFCRDKGIRIIGEQVETERLASQAAVLGIKLQQGYLHGRAELLDGWVTHEVKEAIAVP